MPLALLTAVAVEGLLAVGLAAIAGFDATSALYAIGRHSANPASTVYVCIALLFMAFLAGASAFLLSHRELAGSRLSYFTAILVVGAAITVAFPSGELALGTALTIACGVVVGCLVSRSARLALTVRATIPAREGPDQAPSVSRPSGGPPPELDLTRSSGDTALMLLGGPAFVVAGVWMGLSGMAVGWVCAGIFGLATVLNLAMWFRGFPRLTASPDGLRTTTWHGWQSYSWDRVGVFAVPAGTRGVRRVTFNLASRNGGSARPVSISRALVGFDARLPSNFGMDPRELARNLNRWREWGARRDGS
jgi:hypothetical protein